MDCKLKNLYKNLSFPLDTKPEFIISPYIITELSHKNILVFIQNVVTKIFKFNPFNEPFNHIFFR